ncbi:MAG: hypothetical protein L0H26_11355, partial [Microlunatus sp.]|nr:hypothetical protein [Microlunatus sp.]
MTLLDVDPNLVRPGWTPLFVTLLLGAALFLLARSMLKQFRKINQPPTDAAEPTSGGNTGTL